MLIDKSYMVEMWHGLETFLVKFCNIDKMDVSGCSYVNCTGPFRTCSSQKKKKMKERYVVTNYIKKQKERITM